MLHRFDRPGFHQITLLPGPSSDIEDCDLSIGTLGFLHSQSGFTWSQVSHRMCLHLVTKGSGQVLHQNKTYSIRSGDAFCFYKDETYHYMDQKNDLWDYTWIGIHGHQAERMCDSLGCTRNNPFLSGLSIKPLTTLISEIDAAFRSEDHSLYYPQSAAWRLFDLLHSHNRQDAPIDQLAHVLRRILDEEYHQMSISINQIAHDLHVDRSTLFRHFQRAYKMAPKVYLELQRIRHAKALLRGQQLSIKEVAAHCGYEDPQYFSRVFRKHTGVAPSLF